MAAPQRFVGPLSGSLRAVLWLCGALLLGPVAARAEDPPKIKGAPMITGVAQEGAMLTASATWKADPPAAVAWSWLRCDEGGGRCLAIPGANTATYVATSADVGETLRVLLTWSSGDESDEKRSAPTDVVLPAPTPTTSPTTTPPPAPAPTSTGVPPAAQAPTPGRRAQPRPTARPRVLRPFPVIRIKGRLTARGARITLLMVHAPRGARIAVACLGRSCPVPGLARTAAISRLRQFERELVAGTRLEFTVTRPGAIGKWTEIVIRRGAVPRRRDGCLNSDTMRHRRCPAA
jgi:hypothetical protein